MNPEDQDTKEILINNLANITFIHKDINSEIEDKPPYEYLNDYINSAKNFIPTDSNLWRIEQYTTFLDYRIKQNLFGWKRNLQRYFRMILIIHVGRTEAFAYYRGIAFHIC